MGKLTLEQKKEVRSHLLNGTMSDDDLMMTYHITRRQIQYYRKEAGINRKPGSNLMGKNIFLKPGEHVVAEITPPGETIQDNSPNMISIPISKPEHQEQDPDGDEFLNKNELISGPAPAQDQDVNLCGNCHESGHRTELQPGWRKCPVCGVDLEW